MCKSTKAELTSAIEALRLLVKAGGLTSLKDTTAFGVAEEIVKADDKAREDKAAKRAANIADQLTSLTWCREIRTKMIETGKSSLTCKDLGWDCMDYSCLCSEGGIVWDCSCGNLSYPNSPCPCEYEGEE